MNPNNMKRRELFLLCQPGKKAMNTKMEKHEHHGNKGKLQWWKKTNGKNLNFAYKIHQTNYHCKLLRLIVGRCFMRILPSLKHTFIGSLKSM